MLPHNPNQRGLKAGGWEKTVVGPLERNPHQPTEPLRVLVPDTFQQVRPLRQEPLGHGHHLSQHKIATMPSHSSEGEENANLSHNSHHPLAETASPKAPVGFSKCIQGVSRGIKCCHCCVVGLNWVGGS